jgi:lipoate-protein ligase A
MKRMILVKEVGVSPLHCLASSAYLMEAVAKGRTKGAPVLLVGFPSEEAVVLGRYQKPESAVQREECRRRGMPLLRRLSGGGSALLGEGRLYLALVLPSHETPLECEPRQFLQRYGAGIVRGLAQTGLKARYFGKDVLSIEDRPVGVMSFEIAPDGTALLETIVGLNRSFRPDGAFTAYPPRSQDDTTTASPTLIAEELTSVDEGKLADQLVESMAGLLDVSPEPRELTPLEIERVNSLSHRVQVPDKPEERIPVYLKPWASRPIEEAIGFVEATVRLTQGRFLREVWVHGDFMADSGGICDLQERLRMVPVKRRPVALVIDDVLGAPEHVIMGIRRLGSILEAILDASKRAAEEGGSDQPA